MERSEQEVSGKFGLFFLLNMLAIAIINAAGEAKINQVNLIRVVLAYDYVLKFEVIVDEAKLMQWAKSFYLL